MSRETTEAKALARDLARQWREHRQHCAVCQRASERRLGHRNMCPAGAALWADRRAADRDLAAAEAEDQAPAPGQMPLPF